MNNIDRIRKIAQTTADRDGHKVVIYNLNRFSPLYVVRGYTDGCETDKQFVEVVHPQ